MEACHTPAGAIGIAGELYRNTWKSIWRPAIPQLQHTDDFQLTPDTRLDGVERVFCILRSIPDGMPMLKQLRERFPEEKARAFGTSVFVLSFERAP